MVWQHGGVMGSDDLGGVGQGSDDAPRLPDAPRVTESKPSNLESAPTVPDSAVPFLPDAPSRSTPEPPPDPMFDAKAMVESQKPQPDTAPAYGAMPTATADSQQAVQQLRAEAQKKRRRNRTVARLVFVVFCGIVIAAAYFAYRAFQDEQAQRDDDNEQIATDTDGGATDALDELAGDDPAALTPVGEQAEVIAGMDVLNDVATGSAGGLLGAVDDAQAAVDDLNGAEPAADEPAPDATAGLPTTIEASVLRYDLGSVADPVVHHVAADLSTDTYLIATVVGGDLRDAAESGTADVARYDATAGIATRTGRSDASLAGGADALFVSAVSPSVLLPESAAPHADVTSVGLTAADGSPVAAEAYVVDVEAYRAADPAAAEAWLTVLGLADPTATLGEGMPNLDTDLLDARTTIDELIERTDAGPVTGNPPLATAGQVVVGWTTVDGEPYARSAYAASGDGSFQWLYRVSSVDQPAVAVFGVR